MKRRYSSILVVDDEETIRVLFQELLEMEGHRVIAVASAAEARERLAKEPFDVVVTDLMLPEESGLALLEWVSEREPAVSVILVTGHPDLATAIEALKRGAYDYLTKPVTREALQAVVERAGERTALLREKSRLESENAEYQRSLERKVKERTVRLRESQRRYRELFRETKRAYEELKQAHERLVRSERLAAAGELAARIAHEIRNPLSAISNSVGVLRRDLDLEGEDRHLLEVVVEESQRLASIVADFLQYARPRPVQKASQALTPILENLLLLLSQDQRVSGKLTIERDYEIDLPPIEIDPDQIREAIWNLLMNAAEAMPDGGRLRISVRRVETAPGRRFLEAVISDTGKGIAGEERDRIFEPFHTTKAQGTGLGLAIVQRVLDEHGGSISVESAPGKGSSFSLRFPLTTHERETVEPRADASRI